MSGHGTNPIFLKKKIKVGRPKHSLTRPATQPPTLDNISFLHYSLSKWMSYVHYPFYKLAFKNNKNTKFRRTRIYEP